MKQNLTNLVKETHIHVKEGHRAPLKNHSKRDKPISIMIKMPKVNDTQDSEKKQDKRTQLQTTEFL